MRQIGRERREVPSWELCWRRTPPAIRSTLPRDSSQMGTPKPLECEPNHMLIDTIKTGIVTPNFSDLRLFAQGLLRDPIAASGISIGLRLRPQDHRCRGKREASPRHKMVIGSGSRRRLHQEGIPSSRRQPSGSRCSQYPNKPPLASANVQ